MTRNIARLTSNSGITHILLNLRKNDIKLNVTDIISLCKILKDTDVMSADIVLLSNPPCT
jgi:hypothetical protein